MSYVINIEGIFTAYTNITGFNSTYPLLSSKTYQCTISMKDPTSSQPIRSTQYSSIFITKNDLNHFLCISLYDVYLRLVICLPLFLAFYIFSLLFTFATTASNIFFLVKPLFLLISLSKFLKSFLQPLQTSFFLVLANVFSFFFLF